MISNEPVQAHANTFHRIKEGVRLLRDIGILLGVPAIIIVGLKLYDLQDRAFQQQMKANEAHINALGAENSVLRETQFDRALQLMKGQKELYDLDMAKKTQLIEAYADAFAKIKREVQCTTRQQEATALLMEKVMAGTVTDSDNAFKSIRAMCDSLLPPDAQKH
jgi:hypothetical protein